MQNNKAVLSRTAFAISEMQNPMIYTIREVSQSNYYYFNI